MGDPFVLVVARFRRLRAPRYGLNFSVSSLHEALAGGWNVVACGRRRA
jgi:hypothetical protein